MSNRPFSIAIKDSVTVDDLKDAILKKKRRTGFAKVDPDELTPVLQLGCMVLPEFSEFPDDFGRYVVFSVLINCLATFHFRKPAESITIDKSLKKKVAQ